MRIILVHRKVQVGIWKKSLFPIFRVLLYKYLIYISMRVLMVEIYGNSFNHILIMITRTSTAFLFHKISIICGVFVVSFYIITYPKLFCQRVQFFFSNWLENLTENLFVLVCQSSAPRLRTHNKNMSQY